MFLSRHSESQRQRELAAEADRCRRAVPESLVEAYDWEWPSIRSLAVDDEFVNAPHRNFSLTALLTDEQQRALKEFTREIAQHVAYGLSRPCPVFADAGSTRIEFLGCMAFVRLHRERRLHLEIRDERGQWQRSWVSFDCADPLANGFWIEQFLLPWVPHIENGCGHAAVDAYASLAAKLAERYENDASLDAARQQIVHHLDIPPGLARAVFLITGPAEDLASDSDTLSEMWAHGPFWSALAARHEGLTHFYYLATRDGLIELGDDLGALRARCLEQGLSPAGWRFLCRHGDAAYHAVLHFADDYSDRWLQCLVAYVDWQARAGLARPLLVHYGAAVLVAGGLGRGEDGNYAITLDPRLAQLVDYHRGPDADGRRRQAVPVQEWLDVLEWMCKEEPQFDRNQWRAGWPAVRRACPAKARWERDQQRRGVSLADGSRWDSLVGSFSFKGWRVRPLSSRRELVLEGQRMRHCVANYADVCLAGHYRLFTAEREDSGKPLATIGLIRREDRWTVHQVKGPGNRDPGTMAGNLARQILLRYEDALRVPRFIDSL